MSFETYPFDKITISSLSEYLDECDESRAFLVEQLKTREKYLARLSFSVMTVTSYDMIDLANQWCIRQWGQSHGPCEGRGYLTRNYECPSDVGTWKSCWFLKIAYDFGFNEWYFQDRQQFTVFVDQVPKFELTDDRE